jgi:proline iminopeptidase
VLVAGAAEQVPSFTTYDGTELTCRVLGSGEPLVVIPGGPLLATRYLGNLGGLDAHRELVMLELPHRRVDRIVGDVEALREHLGTDQLDLLAHSAGANLAEMYAAAHPDRLGKLALITPGSIAVGVEPTDEQWRADLRRRAGEPWFDDARTAMLAWDAGDASPVNRAAAEPFFHGRWDAAAQAYAAVRAQCETPDAARTYLAEGALDQETTAAALAKVTAQVLVLIGGLDLSPTVREGRALADLFPDAELVVQPGAGHSPWLDDAERFVGTVSRFLAAR